MKMGLRKGPSAYRLTPCSLAGVQHSPQSHVDSWLCLLQPHGTNGIFYIVEILYINRFCLNEPFSINIILTAMWGEKRFGGNLLYSLKQLTQNFVFLLDFN